jgi:hypothetical protein
VRRSLLIFLLLLPLAAQTNASKKDSVWRAATESELKNLIPARAPVEKERIETESRTASGITNGKAYVAGVVLITAGYSAEGKYSHFFFTQVPLTVGDISLKPGEYVFGWQKNPDSLTVKFYEAELDPLRPQCLPRPIPGRHAGRLKPAARMAKLDPGTHAVWSLGWSLR